MAFLGLLLVAAAVAIGVELVVSNTASMDVELFGETLTGLNTALVFLLGAACLLALVFGLMMLTAGIGRARRIRTERRAEATRQKRTAAELQTALAETAEENDRLRRQMAEEQLSQDTLGGVAVPPQPLRSETGHQAVTEDGRRGKHRLGAVR
jgi:uncharacterized protein (DUF58 family)